MKVVITHPILPVVKKILQSEGHTVTIYQKTRPLSKTQLHKLIKGADAVLSFLTNQMDASAMDACGTQLKVIANYAVGYDNIDVAAARARGISVTHTPCEEVSDAVAEHTIALMLALLRRLSEADRFVKAGKYVGWNPDLLIGVHPKNMVLGLIGLGRIGKRVAYYAKSAFTMKVLYHDVVRDRAFEKETGAEYNPLSRILRKADVVSLHVPLLPSTRHLISEHALSQMKKSALLINTARGPVVSTAAVVKALKRGELGGFAADVFECEPQIACSGSDIRALRKLSNVILTPHIASATLQAREAMARIAAESIVDVLVGKKTEYSV